MNQTKRWISVIVCTATLFLATSCSQKSSSGCPNWGKIKNEPAKEKSV